MSFVGMTLCCDAILHVSGRFNLCKLSMRLIKFIFSLFKKKKKRSSLAYCSLGPMNGPSFFPFAISHRELHTQVGIHVIPCGSLGIFSPLHYYTCVAFKECMVVTVPL